MRRIAIACEKGGVGKTTLTVGLACGLAELGARVLVVDTDHQAAATRWLGRDHLPGLTRTFSGQVPLERLIQPGCAKGVWLVPASTSLVTLERSLDGDPHALFHLRDAVDAMAHRLRPPHAFDYLLFDTPPSLGIVVNSVLCASQEVIVPVEARPMGLAGLRRILATAGRIQRRHHPGLMEPRMVISRANHTAVSRSVEAELRKRYGARVFPTAIAERIAVARASGMNRPASVHEPGGPVARNFLELAREVARIEVLPAVGGRAPLADTRVRRTTPPPATA